MRLSEFSNIYHSAENRAFQAVSRRTKSSFGDAIQKAADAASTRKLKDSIEKAGSGLDLQSVYNQLTSDSRAVLDRLNRGTSIKKDEWVNLCNELKDMGIITQDDFNSVRSDLHIIPIGYYDESGNVVEYETSPMMKSKLLGSCEKSGNPAIAGSGLWLSADDWTGNPLEYLDTWVSELYSWRSDLAKMKTEDGSPKYNNFAPITNHINSCQKVAALVKDLSKI